ncbi:phosphotransferase [Nonomuraea sp. NPDC000554]|uniref:phosphotransferase n=1 Tax=Nonomuraea sp. NPDC000554 TaxID=3154259 RepID=UPI00332D3352
MVRHMDYTPDNIVFRDGKAAALIDFDIAKPIARVDEVANAMMYWAPLCDPVDADPLLRKMDVPRRCRILADAYGMSDVDRSRLVEVFALRTRRAWFLMKQRAEERVGGWARMWDEGIGDEIKRREAWLDRPWRGHRGGAKRTVTPCFIWSGLIPDESSLRSSVLTRRRHGTPPRSLT